MSKLPSINSLKKDVFCENEYFDLAKIYNFLRKFGKEIVRTQECMPTNNEIIATINT